MKRHALQPDQVVDVGNELGEGGSWRPSDQTLWWTDIAGRRLYCLAYPSTALQSFVMPERLASFGFTTARTGLSDLTLRDEPLAGAILVYANAGKGMAETYFDG